MSDTEQPDDQMSDVERPRPVLLTDELKAQLTKVSTATLTQRLQGKGIRNTFLSGLKPVTTGTRMVGYAHTLRYVPAREDLIHLTRGQNAERRAIESLTADEVLIMDARGEPDAGTIGDIFVMRSKLLGAAGVVTDGALRDTPAIRTIGLPVYHQSSHAATWGRMHVPLDHQVPIACAGVTVFPGDILVGDDEGVVVLPAALAAELAAACVAQEIEEEWALERVAAGESTIGTFPIGKDRRAEFEAWVAARDH